MHKEMMDDAGDDITVEVANWAPHRCVVSFEIPVDEDSAQMYFTAPSLREFRKALKKAQRVLDNR